MLDSDKILALQASAGNAAVASLLGSAVSLQRQPAPAAPPATAPAASATARSERQVIIDKLHADSDGAAHQIKNILTGNKYLGSGNQAEIMSIIRPWGNVPGAPNSNMTGMDWLIAGLRHYTYQVGWVVDQTTSAFDELHRRMDKENVAEFQQLIQQSGKQFKNEKPIELAKFEVSQEDIIRGIKAGVELAAALGTGGASIIFQIGRWLLKDVPEIWKSIKAVLSLIDAIKGFRSAGASSKFSEPGLGTLAVEGLFGEITGLPTMGGTEPPKVEESGEARQSGITKVLMMVVHGITVVRSTYNRITGKVNGILHSIDISQESWLPEVAAIYAGIVKMTQLVKDPFSAFKTLAETAQEKVGGFFDKIAGHIGEVVGGITEKLGMIVEPARLMAHLADRLVSTLLNLIITHPPTALLTTVFEVVQMAADKDLIDIIRAQLSPIGDRIIKKIADSEFVQGVIDPLREPVRKISAAIGRVMQKGLDAVKGVQSKVAAFLNPEKLKELTGLGPSFKAPVPIAEAPAAPKDFLGAIKEGLHARLMMIGGPRALALAKSGAKLVWEKAKSGAKSVYAGIKGAILGKKMPYEAGGEHHELWVEENDQGERSVMVASANAKPLEERLEGLSTLVTERAKEFTDNAKKEVRKSIRKIGDLITALKRKRTKIEPLQTEIKDALENLEKRIAEVIPVDIEPRPKLSSGNLDPARFRLFDENLTDPKQKAVMKLARADPQAAGHQYQNLIAADLGAFDVQETFRWPKRRMDVGNRHEVTIEGRNGPLGAHKMDQLWADLQRFREIMMTVPWLSNEAREQLLSLGAQAENDLGAPVLIVVRQTVPPADRK